MLRHSLASFFTVLSQFSIPALRLSFIRQHSDVAKYFLPIPLLMLGFDLALAGSLTEHYHVRVRVSIIRGTYD